MAKWPGMSQFDQHFARQGGSLGIGSQHPSAEQLLYAEKISRRT